MTDIVQRLPLRTKLTYGFGSVAYGIKDNGFATFLLFYYNQVVGMRADLVSLAIALALIADAFIDPMVGHWSDKTRTRIGRRHPWLYASVIPITITWILLWHPPAMSEWETFGYLFLTAMFVRIAFSAYEVPSLALLPELSRDYHDRTAIMRYRFLFGWGGGLAIMFLAYAVFLAPTEEFANGQLNPAGYSQYAILGACAMVIAALTAAIATQKQIVKQYQGNTKLADTAHGMSEFLGAFRYKPFLLLMFAGVFAFTNQWLIFALSIYLFTHVWEFTQGQFTVYSAMLFIAAFVAFVAVTPVSIRLGKARAAALLTVISLTLGTLPYWLRFADLFPVAGTPIMFPVLLTFLVASTAAGISAMILTLSMIADVSDHYEFETGKKTEGLFSSGMFFMQKIVNGIGILLSGLIIALVGLPSGAGAGTVDGAIVDNLALSYLAIATVISLIGAWAYTLFPLGENEHAVREAHRGGGAAS